MTKVELCSPRHVTAPANAPAQTARAVAPGALGLGLPAAALQAIVSAAGLLLYGLFFLVEDTRDGCCWWTSAFWAAPLPPRTDDETGTGGDKGVAPKVADEATPLKDAKQKLPA